MKSSFSTIALLLPFFAQVPALAVPESLAVRAFGGGGGGGFGAGGFPGGSFGKAGSGKGGGASAGTNNSTSVATTSTSSSVAAASPVTNTGAGGNTTGAGANSTGAAAAAAAAAGGGNTGDPQTSLTLDPKVLSTGFENNGQDVPAAGQVASATSSNNFINFCLTVPNLPLTNGKQVTTGSCNTAPMGVIAASSNMPSAKFTNPKNGDTVASNTEFTITMAVSNFQTGAFVNAEENYFSAPQTVNGQGQIIGHSHVVVELLTALDQTTPTDPTKFAFFKGLNSPAANGILSADVTNGLPAGAYKLSSINSAANHQPVLVAIAQHGSLDDAIYFTVSDGGAAAGSGAVAGAGASNATSASVAAAPAAATPPPSAAAAAPAAASSAGKTGGGKAGGGTGKGGKFGRFIARS
jgi:hypothetical protein